MALEFKRACEKCGVALTPGRLAYIWRMHLLRELRRAGKPCLSKLRR
jgi:hypothetical protein